jgi:hypothetical protein
MARKPGTRVEFVLFDVFYEDGSQRSNRKVPSTALGGMDGDAAARAIIDEQDRVIAEKFWAPRGANQECPPLREKLGLDQQDCGQQDRACRHRLKELAAANVSKSRQ